MFFFIFFDISSLLLRYITPAIPRSSRLDLSKNILKNIDSYLNFRTLGKCTISRYRFHIRKYLIHIQTQCTWYALSIGRIRFIAVCDVTNLDNLFCSTNLTGSIFKQKLFFIVSQQSEKSSRLRIIVFILPVIPMGSISVER